jgi:glycosyltransferase involved in cell wall biosynthesis
MKPNLEKMDARRPFKICMIAPQIMPVHSPTAATIRFLTMAKVMREKGNEVIFISRNNNFRSAFAEEDGFKNYKIPSINIRWVRQILFMMFLFPPLIQVAKKEHLDVIFVNCPVCCLAIALYKKMLGACSVHYDVMGIRSAEVKIIPRNKLRSIPESILYRFLESLLIKNVDIITTVNNAHKKILEKFTDKPIYVVRDGIDVSNFDVNDTQAGNTIIDKDPDDVVLTFIGSIGVHRLDSLFNVLPSVLKEVPELKILIVGTGSDYDHYVKKSLELGVLNRRIYFTGYIPHHKVPQYLKISDITYSDVWSKIGFPMKVFEYMAMGKAIVVEDTEATREILIDGVNALLYKNDKSLLEKIILLAKDRNLREELGRNAMELAMKEHTWEKRGEEIINIYNTRIRNNLIDETPKKL